MRVSVICPVLNEERHIRQCVDSMFRQTYPHEDMEVIIADGGSTDGTLEILGDLVKKYDGLRVIDNPLRTAASGMNCGISVARGDIIVRIDAHAIYPDDYISRIVEAKERLSADNVGGVCLTLPAVDSSAGRGIAHAMSSPFGMGNSYFRIGAEREMEVDTVPFGCFSRELFERIGFFDESLIRNQDDEFNGRIIREGGKIYLLPDVKVAYYARRDFKRLWKCFYQYGLYKPLVCKRLGRPATVRQFIPSLFVVAVVSLILLSAFDTVYGLMLLFLAMCWVAGAFYYTTGLDMGVRLSAIWSYMVMHIGYGCGYISGLKVFCGFELPRLSISR